MTVAARSFAVESPDFGKSGSTVADMIVAKCLVSAVAIGLVVAVFALAQVVVLTLGAFKSLRCKLATLV